MFIDGSVAWVYMSMFVICQSDQDVHHVLNIGKFLSKVSNKRDAVATLDLHSCMERLTGAEWQLLFRLICSFPRGCDSSHSFPLPAWALLMLKF